VLWTVTRPSALVGTSAGSIIAGMLALGHTPSDLYDVVISADYAKLIPINKWLSPFRGYLASNRNVTAWLKEITGNKTLGDCKIPFTAICSDLNTGKARTWDSWALPEMPVWEAILSSMSIPDIYPPWQDRYVDGGLICNLGVQYLPGKNKRLGLRVAEAQTVGPIHGFLDRQKRMASMSISASEHDEVLLARAYNIPVIALPAGNLSFLDTGMTRAQKIGLYATGQAAVHHWLGTAEGSKWRLS
jgi:predicted acylesterase/phospholipase RssA